MLLEHETTLSGLSDVKMRNESLRHEFFKDFLPLSPNSPSQYSQNSLKRKKDAISANLNAMLESKQAETRQLTPVNPLLLSSRTPSRSRSASPITFTSSVKVQYKPRICPDQQQFLVQNCDSCGNELAFDLSRSKSATAVLNASNGIFHATPYEEPLENEEIPPPRPPLPMSYVDEQQSKYFLSLPRDWHSLARSASFSTMLYS